MRTIFTRRQIETAAAAMLAAITAIIGIAGRGEEQLGPRFLALEKVGTFRQPVQVVQPPHSDLLFIVEKAGRIRVLDHGRPAAHPFLDIRDLVEDEDTGDEGGMLALAFAPDYPDSRRFYVSYTDRNDDLQVVEYRSAPHSELRALPGSARGVITVDQPTPVHHAGMLTFGPDGYLYVGSGDGGPSGDPDDVAQDLTLLLGKILRIDPNPVRASRGKARPRLPDPEGQSARRAPGPRRDLLLWTARPVAVLVRSRHRRRWRSGTSETTASRRSTTSPPTGEGEQTSVGAPTRARSGFKGGVPRSQTVLPVFTYPHGKGRCAVTGGYVIRDPRLIGVAGRNLVGQYIFGDYCSARLFVFRPHPGKAGKGHKLRFRIPHLSSFGEDGSGRIYVVSQKGGVWRLVVRRKRQ